MPSASQPIRAVLSRAGDERGFSLVEVWAAAALERFLELDASARDDDNVRARLARLRSVAEPAVPPPDTENGASRRCP